LECFELESDTLIRSESVKMASYPLAESSSYHVFGTDAQFRERESHIQEASLLVYRE